MGGVGGCATPSPNKPTWFSRSGEAYAPGDAMAGGTRPSLLPAGPRRNGNAFAGGRKIVAHLHIKSLVPQRVWKKEDRCRAVIQKSLRKRVSTRSRRGHSLNRAACLDTYKHTSASSARVAPRTRTHTRSADPAHALVTARSFLPGRGFYLGT